LLNVALLLLLLLQGVKERTTREWHRQRCFGPFAFYDLHGKEDVPEGSASLVNRAEASFVLCIYTTMLKEVGGKLGTRVW
jgi:hypothetical protein